MKKLLVLLLMFTGCGYTLSGQNWELSKKYMVSSEYISQAKEKTKNFDRAIDLIEKELKYQNFGKVDMAIVEVVFFDGFDRAIVYIAISEIEEGFLRKWYGINGDVAFGLAFVTQREECWMLSYDILIGNPILEPETLTEAK